MLQFTDLLFYTFSSDLSKKHLKKSSSSSKITEQSTLSGVRTIEIKREPVQRSNSGSSCSDSSSGFGSLKNQSVIGPLPSVNQSGVGPSIREEVPIKEHSLKLDTLNPAVSKLQLLQERRKLSEHHPSFANHFGFAARYVGNRDFHSTFNATFNAARNNQVQRRIMMQNSSNKLSVSKSKSSSVEYSKENQSYR